MGHNFFFAPAIILTLHLQLVIVRSNGPTVVEKFPNFLYYFQNTNVRSMTAYACTLNDALHLAEFSTHESKSIMPINIHIPNGRKSIVTKSTSYMQGILIDYHCYNEDNLWMNAMLNASYSWLIYVTNFDHLVGLEMLRLNLLSNVVVSKCDLNECTLYDVRRTRDTGPLNFEEIAHFTNDSLKLGQKRARNDFQGTTIVGGVVLSEIRTPGLPSNLEDRSFLMGRDSFSRYHIVLYRHLERFFNYKLHLVRIDNYGYPLPNGSYSGLVGSVYTGKVDIGVTSIEPRPGRTKLVSFLPPQWKIRIVFAFRQPRALGSFSALAAPLSYEVWASIFGMCLLFSFSYDLSRRFSSNKCEQTSHLEGFTLVVGAMAQQGLIIEAHKTSTRLLCFFLLFLALMVLTYYNASIMNGLLLPAPVSIRSLEQLIAPSSPVQPGLLNITYLVDNRSSHAYVMPNTVKAVKRTPNPVMDIKSGIERVKRSNFALCAEDNLIFDEIDSTFNEAEKCELSYIELLKPFGLSGVIAKNSPFKEMITRGLTYMQENGLADREKKHWHTMTPVCAGSISFFNVSLTAVGLSFLIFLIGLTLSIVIFAIECSCSIYQPSIELSWWK